LHGRAENVNLNTRIFPEVTAPEITSRSRLSGGKMSEENILFQPIKNHCHRDVATCDPGDSVLKVAAAMRSRRISSMIVCEGISPQGILTDRDLRDKVVAQGVDPTTITARDIMNTPLITVSEDDLIFEALYRISKHGIHRICVVNEEGRLSGIITVTDIMRLQTRSPQKLVRDIDQAATLEDLKSYHNQIQDLVLHLVGTGVPPRELVRMIALLNDQLLVRLINLLRTRQFSDLTGRFAFVVLGSEGRREQTLTTDPDNAIIYAELQRLEGHSERLADQPAAGKYSERQHVLRSAHHFR
jgi:CBS domain-containing protein